MAKTPEGRVKAAVQRELQANGIHPFVDIASGRVSATAARGFYYMPVAGPYSVLGIHDFVGCLEGVFWSIETKAPDEPEDATVHQERFHLAVRGTGGISYVGVRDASVVAHLIQQVEVHHGRKAS